MPLVLLNIEHNIATLTLNNDEKRNALSRALITEAIDALDQCRQAQARVVVLRAQAGAKVWSAGHDITELPRSGRDPLPYNDPLEKLIRAVRELSAPIIALIEGSVWGGACELVICSDIPIGAPNATFAFTPAKIGVPYNAAGLLRIMSEMDASVVKEMFFTAKPITAERAKEVGILNHVVPFEQIEQFTYEMAKTIASLAPLSISVIKEQIRHLVNAHPLTPEVFERMQGLRRTVYDSEDYREGITAFLEKRRPSWTGK